MCSYVSPSLKFHISHLRLVHKGDRNFELYCDIGSCRQQFRAFDASSSHVYRAHREALGLWSKYSLQEPGTSGHSPQPSPLDLDSYEPEEPFDEIFDDYPRRACAARVTVLCLFVTVCVCLIQHSRRQ